MKIVIRPIDPTFSKQCIQIQRNDGFRHAYYLTNERVEKLFANGELFYGAFNENNTLIGFASIKIFKGKEWVHSS